MIPNVKAQHSNNRSTSECISSTSHSPNSITAKLLFLAVNSK